MTTKTVSEVMQTYANQYRQWVTGNTPTKTELTKQLAQAKQDLLRIVLEAFKEEDVWKMFADIHGCKKDQEDCLFKKCLRWGTCENLAKGIVADVRKRLEEVFK